MAQGLIRLGACVLGLLLPAVPAVSQVDSFPVYEQTIPVVSVNRERLIKTSNFGKALIGKLTVRQKRLVAENDSLAHKLEKEELELTELRKIMSNAEFTPLAEAFDNKVKNTRRDQDQKAVQLAEALETARFRFFRHAESVIAKMMEEQGILFVLDETSVWLSRGGDVTQSVIERLDAAYAAGEIAVE